MMHSYKSILKQISHVGIHKQNNQKIGGGWKFYRLWIMRYVLERESMTSGQFASYFQGGAVFLLIGGSFQERLNPFIQGYFFMRSKNVLCKFSTSW